MLISEKQIMLLIKLFEYALDDNLTPYGKDEAIGLLRKIEQQQSEELKEVK